MEWFKVPNAPDEAAIIPLLAIVRLNTQHTAATLFGINEVRCINV